MAKKPARILLATAMTLALSTAVTSVVFAQTDTPRDRVVVNDRSDNDFNFGWLGLLGLAGLAGMKRREVDTHRTNQPMR